MNTPWPIDREVEKPKPIKLRAADAATKLINLREAMSLLISSGNTTRSHDWLCEAIDVLRIVAGEKPQ